MCSKDGGKNLLSLWNWPNWDEKERKKNGGREETEKGRKTPLS